MVGNTASPDVPGSAGFIRTGNATNPPKPSELLGYYQTRWPAAAGAAQDVGP